MKILIVGEGKHEFGPAGFGVSLETADGFLFHLLRKICASIESSSVRTTWTGLNLVMRREPGKKFDSKKGLARKVEYAARISRREKCQGVVLVLDCDGDEERLIEMEKGRDAESTRQTDEHQIVCGLAIESIEAWVLGSPSALGAVLNLTEQEMRKQIPAFVPIRIEELKESSGKTYKEPKRLLELLAQMKLRNANWEFRQEVAEKLDEKGIAELERNCPRGFKPFVGKLRDSFGN